MPRSRPTLVGVRFAILGGCLSVALLTGSPASAATSCGAEWASAASAGRPTARFAWRAGLLARTPIWASGPTSARSRRGSISPSQASWLLVLRAVADRAGRCWLQVRLPSRPNAAAAWLIADRVDLEPTAWRVDVSSRSRSMSVYRSGTRLRRFRVVVGAPATRSPRGLFSIVGVWRSDPSGFLGSYVLPLTAHSNVLQDFGGGDGRVGIHGRGGSSLLDPLGTARSHGCVRLTNRAISWIVHTVGADNLPGVPVRVR